MTTSFLSYFLKGDKMEKRRRQISYVVGKTSACPISDSTVIRSRDGKGFFIYPDLVFDDSGQYVTLISHRPLDKKLKDRESCISPERGIEGGRIYFHVVTDIVDISYFESIGVKGSITGLPSKLSKYSVHASNLIVCNKNYIDIINISDEDMAKEAVTSLLSALSDINVKEKSDSKEVNTVKAIGDLSNSISEDLLLKMCNKDVLNLDRLSISIGLALRDIKLLMDEHGISDEDILSAVNKRRIRR